MSDTSTESRPVEAHPIEVAIRYFLGEIGVILGSHDNIDAAVEALAKIIPGKSIGISQNCGITRNTAGDKEWKSSEARWQITVISTSPVSACHLYSAETLPLAVIRATVAEMEG